MCEGPSLKDLAKEYFVKVVDGLSKEYNASFFIVSAPGDETWMKLSRVTYSVANFCSQTNPGRFGSRHQKSDLFVTVDTSATHIAATTGVPMVTMYGCTGPKRWHPINDNARVLTDEPCCPCKCRADECPSNPKPSCTWRVKCPYGLRRVSNYTKITGK